MFYDRFLKRRKNHTVIPIKDMVTSEGVIFFGEDPGVIESGIPDFIDLSGDIRNLSK